jgi:hypothetical protein
MSGDELSHSVQRFHPSSKLVQLVNNVPNILSQASSPWLGELSALGRVYAQGGRCVRCRLRVVPG